MPIDPPEGPADLTAAWLGAALAEVGQPVTVAEVAVDEVGTGQTGSSYRLTVRYGEPTDLPATFVAKLGATDPEVRQRVAMSYRAEVAFYRSVATTVMVPLPRCFLSAISEDDERFVLLLEDLAPARQGDQLAGCSPMQAEVSVVALAGLHGPRWCDPAWLEFTAAPMPKADEAMAQGLADIARVAADLFLERLGDRMREADRGTLDAYPSRVAPWLGAYPDRFSLLHGDYRLDNLMFAPDDRSVRVVDWQTLSVGLPARDLAYFVGTSLEPYVRTDHEVGLVGAYHQALVGWGVEGYTVDECFADYRIGMLQAPLIATLGAAFSTTTGRGDEMMLTMLGRALAAIRDLGTLALIDAGFD
jgi:hypothetical protein